jgi:hypothetical protein
MKRLLLAALLLLLSRAALASGVGLTIPWTIDPYGGTPAEQDAFYTGNTGILLNREPWPRLFAAWRLLHALPVGAEAGKTLALPCCGLVAPVYPAIEAWLAARAAVPDAPPKQSFNILPFRSARDFMSVQTCFPDAFTTAIHTLSDRIAAYGAGDPWVGVWLTGQDAVFDACSGIDPLPALESTAPDWLKADHAYQQAAVSLYHRAFADAERQFDAIAADAGSPWQPMAPYLAARAAVDAALPGNDAAAFDHAREKLAALESPDVYGHAQRAVLLGALDFRQHPDARRTELATELTAPALPPTVAPDFKDSRRLGQSELGDPAYLDWIAVFGRIPDKPEAAWFEHFKADLVWQTDADALAHARARWAATHDPAWLLAALSWSSPGPDAADLVSAARAIPTDSPAYLTVLYHRIRLDSAADPATTRADLDAALARTDLSLTSRNLLLAERTMVAADLPDVGRLAPRQSPCLTDDDSAKGCLAGDFMMEFPAGSVLRPDVRFGDDAAAIIDRLPLAPRAQLAQDAALPPALRLDLGLTTWVRAVLLQDMATADRLAAALRPLLPQMDNEWQAFLAAKAGQDKRFAAWFILAKIPGLDTDLRGTYTRPQGTVADFDGHWHDWLYAAAGAPPVPPPAIEGDIVCFGMCGPGAFPLRLPGFVADAAAQAATERGRFAPRDPSSAVSVWEDVLTYVKAHPSDPRSPEALYWLVRVSRFGTGHNRSSYRAFLLLHQRYPASTWAKASKYFYD